MGALPVAALLCLASLPTIPGTDIDLSVPYAAEGPGPTFDTLGQIDGKDVVQIIGEKPDPTTGHLNMTTVSVRTRMSFAQLIGRWLTTDDTIVPIEQVFPSGVSKEQVQEQNAAAFAASESNATISAMNYLKRPLETMVQDVSEGSPAAQAPSPLHVNDVIVAIGDAKISLPSDVATEVRKHKPGDQITVRVRRGAQVEALPVTLGETPEALRDAGEPAQAFLGVTTVAQPAGDLRVEYNLADVGGPSAGLMFSLSVVDKLSTGQLTHGHFIAGTGTINGEGQVGPIGGITHKIRAAEDAGAEYFLVPEKNCAEALTATTDHIQLLKVDTLSGAVGSLDAIGRGEQPARCGE